MPRVPGPGHDYVPCTWTLVERVADSGGIAGWQAASAAPTTPLRCPAGEPCPREGFWLTPAKAGSRRPFKAGETMPEFKTDYGAAIWQWDINQS